MTEKCWCVKTPKGRYLIEQTTGLTKSSAIAKFRTWIHKGKIVPWKSWYRQGYRCVKVTLMDGWK